MKKKKAAADNAQTRLTDFAQAVERIEMTGVFIPDLPRKYFADGEALSKRLVIDFYPYKGLRSTIRERGGRFHIRLSDLLKDAPREVQNAICWMLLLRMLKRKVPAEVSRTYNEYARNDEMDRRIRERRKDTGSKRMGSAKGKAYDLDAMFKKLNGMYFDGKLKRPALGFSLRKTRTRWGHFDPDLYSITISRTLDHHEVPGYVVEYVLFHEMLHAVHDMKKSNGKRVYHHREFRRDEKRYPGAADAQEWLTALATELRRRRKKR